MVYMFHFLLIDCKNVGIKPTPSRGAKILKKKRKQWSTTNGKIVSKNVLKSQDTKIGRGFGGADY